MESILTNVTRDMNPDEMKRLKEALKRKAVLRRRAGKLGLVAVNLAMSVFILLPLLYAVSIAFMPSGELFTTEMNLLPLNPTLENFKQAMVKIPLGRFILNSFLVASCITFGQILSCSLAAFSFSFLDFKGKNLLFMIVMATMMIPGEATIISNYLTVSGLKWLDSYKVLIIPYLTSAMGIFLFRQFYMSFPISLFESAKIDCMYGGWNDQRMRREYKRWCGKRRYWRRRKLHRNRGQH